MYFLDVTVTAIEKVTKPTIAYRHSLQDKDGWYVGGLRLPEALPLDSKLVIQVMLDADIDYMAD